MLNKLFRFIFRFLLCILVFLLSQQAVPFFRYMVNYSEESTSSIFSKDPKKAIIGEKLIFVEIADNDRLRKKGLSGRNYLEEDGGLFFVFEEVGQHGIWMKDMNFSIDIIWFNEHKEVIYIEQDIRPNSFPIIFGTDVESLFVLEVPAGFVNMNNIKKGDLFTLL